MSALTCNPFRHWLRRVTAGGLAALFAGSVPIIKALIFQGLLHRLSRLIGVHQPCDAQAEDKMYDASFHAADFIGFLHGIRAGACLRASVPCFAQMDSGG